MTTLNQKARWENDLVNLKKRLTEQKNRLSMQLRENESTSITEIAILHIRNEMRRIAHDLSRINGYIIKPEQKRARCKITNTIKEQPAHILLQDDPALDKEK